MAALDDPSSSGYAPETLAREVRESLAERGLPPSFAKLYSQHTRLSTNQPSLQNWRENESWLRLHDAMRLTACGLLERELEIEGWQNSLRRAGELLEWLAHAELDLGDIPLLLLSSAVYQLAGYPARATGLFNQHDLDDDQSRILYYFLKADFPSLLQELIRFWSEHGEPLTPNDLPWDDEENLSAAIHEWVTVETASALGVLCSFMRWGDEQRVDIAIQKLSAIADLFLHGRDPYSWLLAKLCSEVAFIYVATSLRRNLTALITTVSTLGAETLESYLRQSYLSCRALAWPSQASGIAQLQEQDSFVLCTPTGSGKTTIAEIAILQSLFAHEDTVDEDPFAWLEKLERAKPLALYLVPSRALATEVEAKLAKVVAGVSRERVIVTGLYGGNDWGPTDAWLTADDRTILICTYEKAEALMRFLGPIFLNRVSLIVIDEAHNILFDGNVESLSRGESRALRLESLSARLLAFLEDQQSRVIALSAVASGTEKLLSDWITGNEASLPVAKPYRSTRQLIGCLECAMTGSSEIRYDLLDNAALAFEEGGQSDSPFIPHPFPRCPIPAKWHKEGAEKRIRPLLFWAAIHLTQTDDREQLRSVLISAPQQIGGYAEDFLGLLNKAWKEIDNLPTFFHAPTERVKLQLWQQSLAACEDYFSRDSREYQLLEKGIVVHHGKMPGILARLLVQLIDERIVHIVLATSTLSEGINLPFETVLVSSLQRWEGNGQRAITASEFGNLVGRAGRPGFGTEGRCLVVLPKMENREPNRTQVRSAQQRYSTLLGQMQHRGNRTMPNPQTTSPLVQLLTQLEVLWRKIARSSSHDTFLGWLEQTSPVHKSTTILQGNTPQEDVLQALDSLDAIVLAAVVELENVSQEELSPDALEEKLQQIWRRSYAYYASSHEQRLQEIFVRRGMALKETIYPDKAYRRRLYHTSLPPVSGNQLLSLYGNIILHLQSGTEYATWSTAEKCGYIATAIEQLGAVQQFTLEDVSKTAPDWRDVLRWWVDPINALVKPTKTQVSTWHRAVSKHFQYRFNWGLGSIIALATEEAFPDRITSPTLDEWPQTNLPWIAFWLKELLVWGTLDPVVAYLLAHKLEITRSTAAETAQQYYEIYATAEPNEVYNASNIRQWAETLHNTSNSNQPEQWPHQINNVELHRDFTGHRQQWRVLPVVMDDRINWIDPAGFHLATSEKHAAWKKETLHSEDFWLIVDKKLVASGQYK